MEKIEQIIALIKAHDVYFEYSDDHREWRKGFGQRAEIVKLLCKIPAVQAAEIIRQNLPEEVQEKWIQILSIHNED